MASIGFDSSVLTTIVKIVEKRNLNENEHLKIFNALNYIHKHVSTQDPENELQRIKMTIENCKKCIEDCQIKKNKWLPKHVKTMNKHLQKVIVQMMPELHINHTHIMDTVEIQKHTQTLLEKRLINGPHDLKTRADLKKLEECQYHIDKLNRRINDCKNELETARMMIDYKINFVTPWISAG
jgi:hypothetical protein